MRYSAHALIVVMVVGWCCSHAAAESGSGWWPFGRSQQSDASSSVPSGGTATSDPFAQGSIEYATDEHSERRWMLQSPTTKVSWPRLQVPEAPSPLLPRPQFGATKPETNNPPNPPRNAWAQQSPEPSTSSPLGSVTNGMRRVGSGTRAAWHKTVDVLTPGGRSGGTRTAERPAQPSLWKRMFGSSESRYDGPQTIAEWQAQDRPY